MKILITLFFMINLAHAQTRINCEDEESFKQFYFDTTQVMVYKSKIGDCSFNFKSRKLYDAYRSFTISSSGHFFIFNVFNLTGSTYDSTGARSYYLLPIRKKNLTLEYNSELQTLKVHTVSNATVTFDTANFEIDDIKPFSFSLDPDINKFNKGGLEISSSLTSNHYVLDLDWRQGSDPRMLFNQKATLRNNQARCRDLKKVFIRPVYDSDGYVDDFLLNIKTEEGLLNYINNHCS